MRRFACGPGGIVRRDRVILAERYGGERRRRWSFSKRTTCLLALATSPSRSEHRRSFPIVRHYVNAATLADLDALDTRGSVVRIADWFVDRRAPVHVLIDRLALREIEAQLHPAIMSRSPRIGCGRAAADPAIMSMIASVDLASLGRIPPALARYSFVMVLPPT